MYNPKNGFIPVKTACSECFLLHQCFGGFSGEVVDQCINTVFEVPGEVERPGGIERIRIGVEGCPHAYGFHLFGPASHLIQFRTSGNDTKKMGTFATRSLLFCPC